MTDISVSLFLVEAVAMKRVCAWCNLEMGSVETVSTDHRISHGICKHCLDNIGFQEGVPLRLILTLFRFPWS